MTAADQHPPHRPYLCTVCGASWPHDRTLPLPGPALKEGVPRGVRRNVRVRPAIFRDHRASACAGGCEWRCRANQARQRARLRARLPVYVNPRLALRYARLIRLASVEDAINTQDPPT